MTMVTNQAFIFFVFILTGFLIGILFDIFRVLRRSFKTSDIITYIEDIIFWIITGLIILYVSFVFNNGQIRGYTLLGLMLGGILYLLIFSNIFIKVMVTILNHIKKILKFIINIATYPIKFVIKIFQKPIHFIFINLSKYKNNIFNKFASNKK